MPKHYKEMMDEIINKDGYSVKFSMRKKVEEE